MSLTRTRLIGRLSRCAAVVLLLMGVSGCSGAPVVATPSVPQTIIRQGSQAQSQLELKVIDALGDDHLTGARYEVDANRVVVTIWSRGEHLSEQQLEHYRTLAEEVTNGIPVVIEVDDGEPVRPA